jgi:hypothetical protein
MYFFAFIAALPLRPLRLKNLGESFVPWGLGGKKWLFTAASILL